MKIQNIQLFDFQIMKYISLTLHSIRIQIYHFIIISSFIWKYFEIGIMRDILKLMLGLDLGKYGITKT